MKLFSLATQFNSLFTGNSICQSSSMLGAKLQEASDSTGIASSLIQLVILQIGTFFSNLIYMICTFVMNLIEIIQIAVSKVLGIGIAIEDYAVIDETNPLVKILLSDTVLQVFKWVVGLAIILIIIFTIIAIVKSEYQFAVEKAETNDKSRIFLRSLRSFFTLGIFPLIMLLGIIITNAILAGFNDILRGGQNTNIASQIFISSAYQANNFRTYADNDVRVPVVIDFDDPVRLNQQDGYSKEELAKIYKTFQEQGRDLYNSSAYSDFASFSDTIVYKNNRIYNKSTYKGNEKFVCTREQYYVMADFIDYAIKNNVKYYVKSVKDSDIDWKYVDSSIFDKTTNSLTITYKDYSNLKNGKSYKVVYTPKSDNVVTPISDALKTISALLAFDDYSDNTFNILQRATDSINIVEWQTDFVHIKLSDKFVKALRDNKTVNEIISSMSKTDMLILYERARFSSNNDIGATISELADNGYNLPLKKITKRKYISAQKDYVAVAEYYVVSINGTYYQVEKNPTLTDFDGNVLYDDYGDAYYTLVDTDFGIDQVQISSSASEDDKYSVIRKNNKGETVYIKIDKNDVVDFGEYDSKNLGLFAKNDDSFKDVIITKVSGSVETEKETGEIDLVLYDDTVESVIKQNAWPNKLINDLQVIYKDININNLIANGSWLEQLGDYVSATTSNEYSSSIQTGLIHPLGLILSELFLGDISVSDGALSLGSLEYNSKLDDDTIRALIVSLLGEDRYYQTVEQLDYFHEFFNVFMAPVLDELAYYENFELVSGNAQSVQLYTYKAYLASVLLSSNASKWLYQTAKTMLGSTAIKEIIFDENGYYKPFKNLDISTQNTIKSVYENANKRLKDQYVDPGDSAYPEYLYVLEAYIKGDNSTYFEGRLEAILQSLASESARGKVVDSNKKKIIDSYDKLISEINKAISNGKLKDSSSSDNFYSILNEYIEEASSSYSAEKNDYTLNNSGNDQKDYFDNLVSITIESFIILTNEKMGENGTFKEFLSQNFDQDTTNNLSGLGDVYFNACLDYAYAKQNFVETDNSSKNIGSYAQIKNKVAENFKNAQSLVNNNLFKDWENYNKYKNYIINSSKKQSDFSSKTEWDNFVKATKELKSYILTKSNVSVEEIMYIQYAEEYIRNQNTLDRLARYEITFAIESEMTDEANASLDIVVNSKHYSVGQNFTKAKFIEYVFGYDVTKNFGYTPVFVSEDYEGIVKLIEVPENEITNNSTTWKSLYNKGYVKRYSFIELFKNGVLKDPSKCVYSGGYYYNVSSLCYKDGKYYFVDPDTFTQDVVTVNGKNYMLSSSFSDIHDLAVEIGEISARLYQMTNLSNLSTASFDEIVIGKQSKDETNILSSKILLMLIDEKYLPSDLILAFFGIDSSKLSFVSDDAIYEFARSLITQGTYEENKIYLNTVLSYFLMTDTSENQSDYVDYTTLTLKELRIRCLSALIDFSEQSGETTAQNRQRYMALYALGCSDWVTQSDSFAPEVGSINSSWTNERKQYISALKVDTQSQAVILKLAGLENRPYEELVDAEYTIDFNYNGIDEKYGDIFIICIFDEERKVYVPFLMTNNQSGETKFEYKDEDGLTWSEKYGFRAPYSSSYVSNDDNDFVVYYPVVAKGIVGTNGKPTAIREVDGNIEYYRDEVVIRDASDVGLEEYYLSVDQIKVHYTATSYITNSISKLFTGKTIVENIASKFPRFTAKANYNFCYGVNTVVDATSYNGEIKLSYNFGKAGNFEMYQLYDPLNINLVFLLIGTFGLFGALSKALYATIGRVFDVAVDFIIGPLAISTIPLKGEEKGKETTVGYDNWKSKTVNDIISVFGYAVGFNIFFILVPILNNLQLFADASAFADLPLLNKIDVSFLNEIGRLLFIFCSAFMTTRAPKMFSKLLNIENGFAKGESLKNAVKSSVNDSLSVWSGETVVNDAKKSMEAVKNTIPGSAMVREAKQGVKKAYEKYKNLSNKASAKAAKYVATYYTGSAEAGKAAERMVQKSNDTYDQGNDNR